MTNITTDVVLLCLVALQQIFFMWQIQKLVDKVMSRSYTEYVKAKETTPPGVKIDPDVPEDLRSLQEFQI